MAVGCAESWRDLANYCHLNVNGLADIPEAGVGGRLVAGYLIEI